MPKFLIRWNTGHGDNVDLIDAPDEKCARTQAYEAWNAEVQDNSDYDAKPVPDNAADCDGLEWDPPRLQDDQGREIDPEDGSLIEDDDQ